ncbi:MAG: discoidin domain-containing protein [Xanthomonadaceae bacterium]|nr:discoidin domain-containing protein [Xanthomonadaceae bacterium]
MKLALPTQAGTLRRRLAHAACTLAFALLATSAIPAQAAGPNGRLVTPTGPVLPDDDLSVDAGWQRSTITVTDDNGKDISTEIFEINGEKGVAYAPVPEQIRNEMIEELAAEKEGDDVAFVLSAPIIDEIQKSLAQGEPTEALIAYSKLDTLEDETDPNARGPFGSCSDKQYSRSKSFQVMTPLETSTNLGGGFTGSLSVEGSGKVDATGQVKVNLKRTKVFWVCIPYGVRFKNARIHGKVDVDETITLNGTVNYASNPVEYQLAKPSLGSVFFMLGPVPVYIGFNLPVTFGAKFEASATGQLQYRAGHRLAGDFDYTCTSQNCTGLNNIVQTGTTDVSNPFGAGVSVRIKPTVHAEVAVRAYLYAERIAYAQVGVRGILLGDLWGYYGTTCGDAAQDGTFENVTALTFDLDWQLTVTAKADTFLTREWKKTIWESSRYHIEFWVIGKSSALTPMIERTMAAGELGTMSIMPLDTPVNFKLRMRPCWPYTDAVEYTMNWGDGATTGHSGAPASASHTWSASGVRTMNLTAFRDAHGRTFGNGYATSRDVNVVFFPVNKAIQAVATASSTYCTQTFPTSVCDVPAKANDGNNAMASFNGWRSRVAMTSASPQWIELAWAQPILVSTVKFYGVAGWGNGPVDYDIEYWDGANWIKAAVVRNNTADTRAHSFAPARFQTNRVRLLVFRGSISDPYTVRLNEIEVY